jgi:hypothetical protein
MSHNKIMRKEVAIILILAFALHLKLSFEKGETHPVETPTEFLPEKYDEALVPIDENAPVLNIRNGLFLSEKEEEYYRKNTWDSSKTLEQNKKMVVDDFMKTCVDEVEDLLSTPKGVFLKIKSQFHSIFLTAAQQVERLDKDEVSKIIYLMTESPSFARLIRALLTKYKASTYRPQKALFLFSKGEANHSSYDGLRYVLNIRTSDHAILSALDCSKRKMLFGEIVFHEMLHWYHRVSDTPACEIRGKSMNCILRRLYALGLSNPRSVAKYFSNDEEYYTMYGLKEENGELVLDVLCEATYTYEQRRYIRASHLSFNGRFSVERNFIFNGRDIPLLSFFQNNPLPEYGKGEFKCSDLSE